jgi:hypothetical protein
VPDDLDADELDAEGPDVEAEGAPDDFAGPEAELDEFIRQQCRVGRKETCLVQELLTRYSQWCEARGLLGPSTVQTFGRSLRREIRRLGNPAVPRLREGRRNTATGRSRVYVGIGLRAEADG